MGKDLRRTLTDGIQLVSGNAHRWEVASIGYLKIN